MATKLKPPYWEPCGVHTVDGWTKTRLVIAFTRQTGRPLACYAVWQDGEISLKEFEYPVAETTRGIRGMPIPEDEQDALIGLLKTGSLPTLRALKSTG